jgi:hypothetical protein
MGNNFLQKLKNDQPKILQFDHNFRPYHTPKNRDNIFRKKTFYVKTNGALDNYETNIDGVLQLLLQAHVILTTLITNTIKFTYQILLCNFFIFFSLM